MRFSYANRQNIDAVPKIAGVYMFLHGKTILYIGKAANLRSRVKSHFTQPSWRDNLFFAQVNRIGYCETNSEIDALLLESSLIKKHQPKYNVTWKDDKNYFYVAITKETLPRVFLTHQPGMKLPSATPGRASLCRAHSKGSHITFGPFIEGRSIKQVLQLLRKIFPYYTRSAGSGQAAKRHPLLPCPYCHIGLCPGPESNVNVKTYKQNIKNLAAVLKGRRVSVLKNLKKAMELASKNQDFEKAAVLRNQVFALENIVSHASLTWLSNGLLNQVKQLPKPWSEYARMEAYDISNIQGKQSTGSMVTFISGKPAKEWYRKFKIHITGKSNDFAMMQELILRRLKHTEWPYPNLMLIDGGKGQLTATLKAISSLVRLSFAKLSRTKLQTKLQKIKVAALAKRHNELFFADKKEPVLLKDLPQEVSNLLLRIRDEAHRFAIYYHRVLRKKSVIENL